MFRDKKADKETIETFNDLRKGDIFHEMYSYWICILDTGPLHVVTLRWTGQPPTHPEAGAQLIVESTDQFRKTFSYKSISGYSIQLYKRGYKVDNLIAFAKTLPFKL